MGMEPRKGFCVWLVFMDGITEGVGAVVKTVVPTPPTGAVAVVGACAAAGIALQTITSANDPKKDQ
jgi:hypothetical protein